MLVPIYRSTRSNIPEDRNLNVLCKIISHVCKSPLDNIPLTYAKQISSFENTLLTEYSVEIPQNS